MEKELFDALEMAVEHLDYCGWGDRWERGCAMEKGGIHDKIMVTYEKYKEEFA